MDAKTAKMTPIRQTITGLISGVIVGGIVALIMGAIMKKNRDVFEDTAGGTI